MGKKFVIAIDGPAGSGKSTVARLLAGELGFLYVDTGAMYRAITLKAMNLGIPFHEKQKLSDMVENTDIELYNNSTYRVILDGKDVSREIRSEDVGINTHYPASIIGIRRTLWRIQRNYREKHNIVMEGRDIGTKVFPDAQLKVFLDASPAERARRRFLQLEKAGQVSPNIEKLEEDIRQRDKNDMTRDISPLVKSPDALYIDTTGMTINEVVDEIKKIYRDSSGLNL